MQVKLLSNFQVQVSKRVHVSRIVLTPFAAARTISDDRQAVQLQTQVRTTLFLPIRNSKHRSIYAHFAVSDANWSLLTPRHRCYALLSSAMSPLVRETSGNSYQPCQDGLW